MTKFDDYACLLTWMFVAESIRKGKYIGISKQDKSGKWCGRITAKFVSPTARAVHRSCYFVLTNMLVNEHEAAQDNDVSLLQITDGRVSPSLLNFPQASTAAYISHGSVAMYKNVKKWRDATLYYPPWHCWVLKAGAVCPWANYEKPLRHHSGQP